MSDPALPWSDITDIVNALAIAAGIALLAVFVIVVVLLSSRPRPPRGADPRAADWPLLPRDRRKGR